MANPSAAEKELYAQCIQEVILYRYHIRVTNNVIVDAQPVDHRRQCIDLIQLIKFS